MNYNFCIGHQTAVYFGANSLNQTGENVKNLGEHALLVLGRSSMKNFGFVEKVQHSLKKANIKVTIFEGIEHDPDLESIDKGTQLALQNKVDFIIGLGGGSVIDASKAIAATVGSKKTINELFYKMKDALISDTTLPIVAIPSTSGTGSELSKGAILFDKKQGIKSGLRDTKIIPKVAIVDPCISSCMSPFQTAVTGFDATAHAIETYLSKSSNMITKMYSEHALKLLGLNLLHVIKNRDDIKARAKISFASMIVGYNLVYSSTCLPHRLQYPLSVKTNCIHGVGLSTLYPSWLENMSRFNNENLKIIINIWSQGKTNKWEYFCDWLDKLEIRKSVKELGCNEDTCYEMAKEVTGSIDLDPSYKGDHTILNIYLNSLN